MKASQRTARAATLLVGGMVLATGVGCAEGYNGVGGGVATTSAGSGGSTASAPTSGVELTTLPLFSWQSFGINTKSASGIIVASDLAVADGCALSASFNASPASST